jgi:hypothetical protein
MYQIITGYSLNQLHYSILEILKFCLKKLKSFFENIDPAMHEE